MSMMEVLSRSLGTFFGQEYNSLVSNLFPINSEYINAIYELLFVMIQHGNWSMGEAHCLPIALRNWFYEKIINHLNPKTNQ